MKDYSDEELIQKIQSSDQRHVDQALEYLYREYFDKIVYFIQRNGGNSEDAEDVFQDSFLAFYNQIREGKTLDCSLQTYLYSINRNLWLKKLRKRNIELNLNEEHESVAIDENAFTILVATEEANTLADLMEQLGPRCQELLVYFYFEKLRLKQIVKVMGWNNEKTAKNIKARCLKKLKELMKKNDLFGDHFN